MDTKDTYTSVFLKAANEEADEETVKKFRKLWWYNVRAKENSGLRLTEVGLNYIENDSKIKTYKIELDKDITITPQVLIWLDQFLESPYYIDKKHIIVLKERSAFELHLFRGDVKKLGYARAMSKRLRQE
jgi:hypothetical protein